jgi:hypothetical protein
MLLLTTHQIPAARPKLLASGVAPLLVFTVPRPMPAPSMLKSSWTAITRITPPKMAAHEIRRCVCGPPSMRVVVSAAIGLDGLM